jgi:hypothetical protein
MNNSPMSLDDGLDSAIPAAPAQPPAGPSSGAPPGTGASPAQPAGGAGLRSAESPARRELLAVIDRQHEMLARLTQRHEQMERHIATIEERLANAERRDHLEPVPPPFLTDPYQALAESTPPDESGAVDLGPAERQTDSYLPAPTLPLR